MLAVSTTPSHGSGSKSGAAHAPTPGKNPVLCSGSVTESSPPEPESSPGTDTPPLPKSSLAFSPLLLKSILTLLLVPVVLEVIIMLLAESLAVAVASLPSTLLITGNASATLVIFVFNVIVLVLFAALSIITNRFSLAPVAEKS